MLFSNRSGAFLNLGRYEEALADAERTMALRPEWWKGIARKGFALHGLGRYAEAIATFEAGKMEAQRERAAVFEELREVKRLEAQRREKDSQRYEKDSQWREAERSAVRRRTARSTPSPSSSPSATRGSRRRSGRSGYSAPSPTTRSSRS